MEGGWKKKIKLKTAFLFFFYFFFFWNRWESGTGENIIFEKRAYLLLRTNGSIRL